MKTEESFGSFLRTLREERNLTLREVSEYSGIDISMLGKIEKNSRKPTKSLIRKFSELFNVNERDLTISFISDNVAYQVMNEEEFSNEILRVAEEKVKYLKNTKNPK